MQRKLVEYKIKFVLGAVFLVLLVLAAKLSFLQLVQTEEYRTLARNNYIRIVPVFAPRGEIFDRTGRKIVTNRPIYTVSINDMSLRGTTYRIYLDRVGADTVRMAGLLSGVLVEDEYYLPAGTRELPAEEREAKRKSIEERIKEKIRDNKTRLENGTPVEIARAYEPATAAAIVELNLAAYGVRVKKDVDLLGKLIAMLFREGVFKEKTIYEVEARVREDIRTKRPYEPVVVAEDIPLDVVVKLRERQMELPGVLVDVQPVRAYPYRDLLTHVLGYVQNIKPEQYKEHKDEGYLMTDLYGQNGLELVYEKYLRGEHGARQVEVDTYSRPVRYLGMKQPVPGNDIILTVDLELQMATERALADGINRARRAGYDLCRAGSAVVMDVNTGAILAMASYPSYNPGLFTGGMTIKKWNELQKSGALVNRALALYPPGSTFKMVTAAAILEKNVVDPEYEMPDPGYYMLGSKRFSDWKPGGHGKVDLRKALQVSCDTYFWQFGRQVGAEAIAHYARQFGLGSKTGIALPGEAAGLVPTPSHKYEMVKNYLIKYNDDFARVRQLNKSIEQLEGELQQAESKEKIKQLEARKKELEQARDRELEKQLQKYTWELNWQAYDTLNMAIGQGDNWYSPLQLVTYVAAIANGGVVYKPYLVQKIVSPHGEVIKETAPTIRHRVDIDPANLQIIREGMHMVTLPPYGTAAGVFAGFQHSAAAKTGTAEVYDASGKKKGNHALFVAFAPFEKPEVAVAVVLEFGYSGSGYAGPVARQILDAYFAGPEEGAFAAGQIPSEEPLSLHGEKEEQEPAMPGITWPGWRYHPGEVTLDEHLRRHE